MSTAEKISSDILRIDTIVGVLETLIGKKNYQGPVNMVVIIKPGVSEQVVIHTDTVYVYTREPDALHFTELDVSVPKEGAG